MKTRVFLFVLLALVYGVVLADARIVEAPGECHFPLDNANVDNEVKVVNGKGYINQFAGGASAHAQCLFEYETAMPDDFVIDGQTVKDPSLPEGKLVVRTSGAASGTNCNVVTANGTAFAGQNWESYWVLRRTTVLGNTRANIRARVLCRNLAIQQ